MIAKMLFICITYHDKKGTDPQTRWNMEEDQHEDQVWEFGY